MAETTKKNLVVDYEGLVGIYQSIARAAGFNDLTFENITSIPAAIEAIEPGKYDLILSGYRLSGHEKHSTGVDFLRAVSGKLGSSDFYLVTVSAGPELEETVRNLGGRGVIFKNFEELKTTVSSILKEKYSQDK